VAKTSLEIASLARVHTRKAVRTLVGIMNQPNASASARVAAAVALLDRGWGKPKQSHESEVMHRYVIEIPALMDNAEWEAEGLERLEPPGKVQ
jgi:hypothetical protein